MSNVEVRNITKKFRTVTALSNISFDVQNSEFFVLERFDGSIMAGVDEIKKGLKPNPITGKPSLSIFDLPENKVLIKAMETVERDQANNEDKTGVRDKISEGKHDTHACLRYIHQMHLNWFPEVVKIPRYEPVNEMVAY